MSIMHRLMGNAVQLNEDQIVQEVGDIFADHEDVQMAFKLVRDMYVFSNIRLILIDKQGIRGKKAQYLSIPYKAITSFSVETSGTFDMDSELKIWISGQGTPVNRTLKKGTDVLAIQAMLATYVCK